jgi:folate-binding protein YgfZ
MMQDLDPSARCAPAPDRGLIAVTGADRLAFLQGLVTQDLRKLPAQGLMYGAMLTPQGKLVSDFFVLEQGDAIWIDAPAALAPGLMQRLGMFRLRAAVDLAPVDAPVTRGIGPAPEGALADPRHPDMGWRLYGVALSAGDPVDWDALRVAAMVPETGAELEAGESYILEMDFERLKGVDFRKGCYVGQEVTARMHLKTELRKGLVRVLVEGPAQPGAEITSDGKPAGRLHTVAGARALAWMRFDRLHGALRAGEARLAPEAALPNTGASE